MLLPNVRIGGFVSLVDKDLAYALKILVQQTFVIRLGLVTRQEWPALIFE